MSAIREPITSTFYPSCAHIPYEIVFKIFAYTELKDYLTLVCVSKSFKETAQIRELWKIHAAKLGLKFLNPTLHPKDEVKAFYEIKGTKLGLHIAVASQVSPTAFKLLPTIELENQLQEEGKINLLKAPDMSSPVMKGYDKISKKALLALRFIYKKSIESDPKEIKAVVISELNPLKFKKEIKYCISTNYNIEDCFKVFMTQNLIVDTIAKFIRREPIPIFTGEFINGKQCIAEKMDDGTNIVEIV